MSLFFPNFIFIREHVMEVLCTRVTIDRNVAKWYKFLYMRNYTPFFAISITVEFGDHIYVSLRLRVQNGISRLISALCVNCLISILEYSRIIDYSIIWLSTCVTVFNTC